MLRAYDLGLKKDLKGDLKALRALIWLTSTKLHRSRSCASTLGMPRWFASMPKSSGLYKSSDVQMPRPLLGGYRLTQSPFATYFG